jgi:hypothetical protein
MVWWNISQTPDGPRLDRVDGKGTAVDPPPRLRAQVLVVVAEMPDEIGHLVVATRPVVRDGRDAAQRVTRLRPGGVHLADDRVLGALHRQRFHRGADAVAAQQQPNRLQRAWRIG